MTDDFFILGESDLFSSIFIINKSTNKVILMEMHVAFIYEYRDYNIINVDVKSHCLRQNNFIYEIMSY